MIVSKFNFNFRNVKNNIGFSHIGTVGSLNGRTTIYAGEQERTTITAGSLEEISLTDLDVVGRFSLIANLKHNACERNVFLMRDHVKNTVFIMPNINLPTDITAMITGCPDIEIHTVAEVTGIMNITTEVDYDRFVILNRSNKDDSENVGLTTTGKEYQMSSESLFFSLGNVSDVLGESCKIKSIVTVPDLKGSVKMLDVVLHNKNMLLQLKP